MRFGDRSYLTESVEKVVLQHSIPAQIRQLLLHISNQRGLVDIYISNKKRLVDTGIDFSKST